MFGKMLCGQQAFNRWMLSRKALCNSSDQLGSASYIPTLSPASCAKTNQSKHALMQWRHQDLAKPPTKEQKREQSHCKITRWHEHALSRFCYIWKLSGKENGTGLWDNWPFLSSSEMILLRKILFSSRGHLDFLKTIQRKNSPNTSLEQTPWALISPSYFFSNVFF